MTTHLCLLVSIGRDPDSELCRGIVAAGFRTCVVSSLHDASTALRQWTYDLALLLRSDDDRPGVQTRELRACCAAPIVVAARRMDEAAQLEELDAGAAGVIAASESPRLVGARLRQLVAATAVPLPKRAALRVGSLHLDPGGSWAIVGQQPLALTPSQFEVLWGLATRSGDIVTRETLLQCLRTNGRPGRRSVDTHVYWIRRRLESACALDLRIEAIHGRGYCLSRTIPRIGQRTTQESAALRAETALPAASAPEVLDSIALAQALGATTTR